MMVKLQITIVTERIRGQLCNSYLSLFNFLLTFLAPSLRYIYLTSGIQQEDTLHLSLGVVHGESCVRHADSPSVSVSIVVSKHNLGE